MFKKNILKMAIGSCQKMSKEAAPLSNNWISWSTNFFLFFLTASQALLWPWSPVILKAAGLSSLGTAISLSILNLSSILGVVISLWVIKKTRSGAVRRMFLLGLAICSVFFCLSAVFILPHSERQMFCSVDTNFEKSTSTDNNLKLTKTHTLILSKEPVEILNTSVVSNEKTTAPISTSQFSANKTYFKNSQLQNESLSKLFVLRPYNVSVTPLSAVVTKSDFHTVTLSSPLTDSTQNKVFTEQINVKQYDNNKMQFFPDTNLNKYGKLVADKFPFRPMIDLNAEITENKHNLYKAETNNLPNEGLFITSKVPYDLGKGKKSSRDFSNFKNLKEKHLIMPHDNAKNLYQSTRENKYELGSNKYLASSNSNKEFVNDAQDTSPLGYFTNNGNDHLEEKTKLGDANEFAYHDRKTSSGNLQSNYWNARRINLNKKNRFIKRSVPITQKNSTDKLKSVISVNDMIFSDNANIGNENKLGNDNSSSLGMGVAALLILGFFTGGGIEAAVSKFKESTRCGLSEDVKKIDILEITISPSFQLCVLGQHRHWSLLTCSLWITLPTIFVGLVCQMRANITWPYTVIGIFHGLTGIMIWFILLFIPIPYGSLRSCSTRRPLSLYFDNEVIREGIRRVAFHGWAFMNGVLMSLPIFYSFWLLQEPNRSKGEVFVAQTIGIIALYFGEAVVYPAERWIGRKFNVQGLMIASGVIQSIHFILSWSINILWLRSGFLLLVGYSMAFMWIVIRNNALLLGTSSDQEQEAWASWICWKIGLTVGAFAWPYTSDNIEHLLIPGFALAMASTFTVLLSAILTRSKNQSRRRIYHSLDLTNVSDDENEELSSPEEEGDWLEKRAHKEGINL